ncbi:MAG: alpha/beta fold hydrolase [Natronospirillum sp.]|uniref:alpha/beta fold hydrolase n=1 Tax=Natronospirillum sp. TaxID=2812955 RepID=UPI0025D77385|nr:alpha/beta fold hydrolase [Natronospirillum sp.]MCH8552166.1 alpha/beta fold hydrolase [Natronospirillum sp.]
MSSPTVGSHATNTELSDALPQRLSDLVSQVAERQADFPDLIIALSPLIDRGLELPTETALELSVALHEIEAEAREADALYQLVDQQTAPAIAVNRNAAVLALNAGARQLFNLNAGDNLTTLGVTANEFQTFQRRLAEVAGATLLKVTRPGTRELPMVMLGSYTHRYRAFVLTALQHHWPTAVDKALESLFRLTRSEREVLSCLAQGQTVEQIAQLRSSAISTVRQQIKSVLQKMGTSAQVQAATMAAAAANALTDARVGSDALRPDRDPLNMAYGECLREGRRIGWRRYGQPGGKPVVMLHGPFFGAGDFEAERVWAKRCELDVFALERPGYGRTELSPRGETMVDTVVSDARLLMDLQSIPEAVFLTHEIGLIPALALSVRHPERVTDILAVSAAPPFRALAQLTAMPPQQRIFIWAAQNTQWLVRLLIRLGMVRLRKLGPKRWMEAVFGEVPEDIAVLNRPDHQAGVIGTYSLITQQAGAGFEADLEMALSDWEHWLTESPAPLTLLHGTKNQTTRLEFVQLLTQMKPGVQLTAIEGCGQTLAIERPDVVYQALRPATKHCPEGNAEHLTTCGYR